MLRFIPTRDAGEAAASLARLLRRPEPACFAAPLRSLRARFRIYADTCPVPLAAAGLAVTAEIRSQSELYLPLGEIRAAFNQLYRRSLTYAPVLSSTPFHLAPSWADLYAGLPAEFQLSPDPSRLLETLLGDDALRLAFLFHSFLPDRFYGCSYRYPGQTACIGEWLKGRPGPLRCLDAACGTGEESYGLAHLFLEQGLDPDSFRIEGWTLEPLEVWAAACGSFPHDPARTERFRSDTAVAFESGAALRLEFRSVDLLDPSGHVDDGCFELILCNGLLGGPIVSRQVEIRRIVSRLEGLLAPGGMLLAADRFHGGWKRKCPQQGLRALFEANGLRIVPAREGLAGLKPDQ